MRFEKPILVDFEIGAKKDTGALVGIDGSVLLIIGSDGILQSVDLTSSSAGLGDVSVNEKNKTHLGLCLPCWYQLEPMGENLVGTLVEVGADGPIVYDTTGQKFSIADRVVVEPKAVDFIFAKAETDTIK